jgi:hypothetical protein
VIDKDNLSKLIHDAAARGAEHTAQDQFEASRQQAKRLDRWCELILDRVKPS